MICETIHKYYLPLDYDINIFISIRIFNINSTKV
jgi:hypothetical protein